MLKTDEEHEGTLAALAAAAEHTVQAIKHLGPSAGKGGAYEHLREDAHALLDKYLMAMLGDHLGEVSLRLVPHEGEGWEDKYAVLSIGTCGHEFRIPVRLLQRLDPDLYLNVRAKMNATDYVGLARLMLTHIEPMGVDQVCYTAWAAEFFDLETLTVKRPVMIDTYTGSHPWNAEFEYRDGIVYYPAGYAVHDIHEAYMIAKLNFHRHLNGIDAMIYELAKAQWRAWAYSFYAGVVSGVPTLPVAELVRLISANFLQLVRIDVPGIRHAEYDYITVTIDGLVLVNGSIVHQETVPEYPYYWGLDRYGNPHTIHRT